MVVEPEALGLSIEKEVRDLMPRLIGSVFGAMILRFLLVMTVVIRGAGVGDSVAVCRWS